MDHRNHQYRKRDQVPAPPTFTRPGGTRAVRIVDPVSRNVVLGRDDTTNGSRSGREFSVREEDFPLLGNAGVSSRGPAQMTLPPPPSAPLPLPQPPPPQLASGRSITSDMFHDDDELQPGFNVYARPFVPEALTIINTLNGKVIDTPPGRRIDFVAYVGSYFGRDFLNRFPELENAPNFTGNIPTTIPNSPSSVYQQVLRRYLDAEIEAQKRENESYSLYGHEVIIKSVSDPQDPNLSTITFHVPGLRENSPYVEEGDVVQLRHLYYDSSGRILGMDQWLAPPLHSGYHFLGGRYRGEPAPGWSGIVYNARVAAVTRREEQLEVKISRLSSSMFMVMPVGIPMTLKCNITFPVQQDRYAPMFRVLPVIQESLSSASSSSSSTSSTIILPTSQIQQAPQSGLSPPSARTQWLSSMLFPTETDNALQTSLNTGVFRHVFHDTDLNYEQKRAVENICERNYGSLPFLISGPPGTGKTKTLVEVAVSLLHPPNSSPFAQKQKYPHILFCAPSDPAADTLVQRLSACIGQDEMLRLNRTARTFGEVPDAVMRFCYVANDTFCLPPLKTLMRYKIVVTTLRDSALLMYARITNADLYAVETGLMSALHPEEYIPSSPTNLHWTALIIDEAAQALEPEALIALAVVAPPTPSPSSATIELETGAPQVIMAGDEFQLGPRTSLRTSPLTTSLFARLFARPVYTLHRLARSANGKPPPRFEREMLPIRRPAFTNLIRNYRSHPAILAIPSALFYHDTLEPCASEKEGVRLEGWSGWRGRKWPVLWCENGSPDDLEGDGGGWYNPGEARLACRYALSFVSSGLVAQNEVCIMSPFKSQVACLRKMIREPEFKGLWEVNIGPVEAFQGLEKGVVILCTTRSRRKFLAKDQELGWGVIGMVNKMNVALTRAMYGLVVIGKREVLVSDPCWESWVGFCERNGLVEGESVGKGVNTGEGTGGRFGGEGGGQLTRLEKVLLSGDDSETLESTGGDDEVENEGDEEHARNGKRRLGVYPQEDEMWIHGMAALEVTSVDEMPLDDEDDEDEEEGDEEDGEGEGDD